MAMSSSIFLVVACIGVAVQLPRAGADDLPLPLPGHVEEESASAFAFHLASADSAGNVDHEVRAIRQALLPIWGALAKNEQGNVSSRQAQTALRRYFGQHLGWKVSALESSRGSVSRRGSSNTSEVESDSLSLGGVASLARAMKKAILRMERRRLTEAYEALGFGLGGTLSDMETDRVLAAYVASLVLGRNFIQPDLTGIPLELRAQQAYSGWAETQIWLRELRQLTDDSEAAGRRTSVEAPGKSVAQVQLAVEKVQEGFGQFQDKECRRLRDTLLSVQESSTPGLVRLSEFYRRGLETGLPFVEKADYLQQLGALDTTTGLDEPRVVVVNYVLSEANCLSEQEGWSLCCIDECESYLQHLERQVAAPEATAARIAGLLDDLLFAANSSYAPLGAEARRSLEELAQKRDDAMIQLHSTDFAEWLHTAFPAVCPRPSREIRSADGDEGKPKASLSEGLMKPQGMRKYIDYIQRRQERSSQYSLQSLLVQEADVMEQWQELLFLPEALPDAAQEFANALRQGALMLLGLGFLVLAAVDQIRRCLGLEGCLGHQASFLCLMM
eukprot:TRINITY_DN82456_c0_g1_i1.p1 TRINITY_DN82456_c0_g1~~TRINITY_DN82456_c0_g1_i1.p1  ORF type:complete len:595 (+),score=136.98 TRINITY_DN82456_c0_g1_i1:109-1785(+)